MTERKPCTLLLRLKDPALYAPDAAGGRPGVAWHPGKPGKPWRVQWCTPAGVKARRMAIVLALDGKALLFGCAVADIDRDGLQSMLDIGAARPFEELARALAGIGKLVVLDEHRKELDHG